MNQIIESTGQTIAIIVTAIGPILGLIVTLKTNFWKANKVINKKYVYFKTIREEYLKDNINGYFALQNYLGIRLSKIEMDFILKSSDAYKIMSLVKTAAGRYHFDGNSFHVKIEKSKYALPMISYFISSIPILFYLSYSTAIIKTNGLLEYIVLLLIIFGVLGPILLISIFTINEISSTRFLEKITNENILKNEKEEERSTTA